MNRSTICVFLTLLFLQNAIAHKPENTNTNNVSRIGMSEANYVYCPATYNGKPFAMAMVSTNRANPPYHGTCSYEGVTIDLPGRLAPGASTWKPVSAYVEECWGPTELCPFVQF